MSSLLERAREIQTIVDDAAVKAASKGSANGRRPGPGKGQADKKAQSSALTPTAVTPAPKAIGTQMEWERASARPKGAAKRAPKPQVKGRGARKPREKASAKRA